MNIQPQIIGHYSVDGNNTYHNDATSLKIIRNSLDLPLELSGEINEENLSKIIQLFKPMFALTNLKKFLNLRDNTKLKVSPSFVCTKATLTQLCTYNLRITACSLNGVIYFMPIPITTTENTISDASKFGLEFQKLMQTSIQNGDFDRETTVNSERFHCVYTAQLGKYHTVLYSSTMDGIRLTKDTSLASLTNKADVVRMLKKAERVDLHTLTVDDKEPAFRDQKLTKFALQAYLANISKIIIGYRFQEQLKKVTPLETDEVNRRINDNKQRWLTRLNRLFDLLKDAVTEERNYFFSWENEDLNDITDQFPDIYAELRNMP